VALAVAIVACGKGTATPDASDAPAIVDAAEEKVDLDAAAAAARALRIEKARADFDAGAWHGPELYAAATRTSVMSMPAWPPEADAGVAAPPELHRLGYLRHGSHVPVFAETIVNEACPEGWFELLEGGFVCGKYASLDPKDPSVKFAANAPNLESPMPYRYGFSIGRDTPVYRRVLSHADRLKYEPWLAPPPELDAGTGEESDNPYFDAGAASPRDAGIVKLGDLRGRGVLVRKMMRGFFVALDRDFKAASARWWRTAEGFAIPYERLMLQTWSPTFHGSWIKREDGAPDGTGAAALVKSDYAVRYTKNDKGKMTYGPKLEKWSGVELAGDPEAIDGVQFQQTTAGGWVRLADLLVAHTEPPADLGASEKWIDVDLEHQTLVAFEGKTPVYTTRISSGRRVPWDPEHDRPTPTGTYRIYEKHISATMDGDVASDGPYSIEDVPWVMYFSGSYALHGTFWHNLFGTTRSHGCVNMAPIDAREIFFWTEPRLPKGWHGVFQTETNQGTRVVIHEPPAPAHTSRH
jgi:hypothetical protein